MKATVEISMYALRETYKEDVLRFLSTLSQYTNLEIVTNGLSTQIIGEYDQIMDVLKTEIAQELNSQPTIFVLKIGKGELKYNPNA